MKNIFIFCSLFLLFSCSSGKTVDENSIPSEYVSAAQIFKEFSNNEVSAKEKFGNKIIKVRGIVASIENFGNGSVVLLNNGNADNVGVKCYFNEDQNNEVKNLNKQMSIIVKGIGSSSLLIDYNLTNCRIVKD